MSNAPDIDPELIQAFKAMNSEFERVSNLPMPGETSIEKRVSAIEDRLTQITLELGRMTREMRR